jgi:hypothetical protein
MARPASWLPRLHEIRRAVSSSIRSHYTRRELEGLFQLQPRAALKLIELLPTASIGTALLVEKEALLSFLEGANVADDITAYFERMRLAKAAVSKKKIRSLVRRDREPLTISSLPQTLRISPGRLEINFSTVLDLTEAMYALARVLENDEQEFVRRFEQSTLPAPDRGAQEMELLFLELAKDEADRNKHLVE